LEKKEESTYKSGTTIVGITGSDFVLLASDKKGTMGNFAFDLNAQKIYTVSDKAALGLAGSLGDAQQIIRLLKAEIKLYEIERDKTMGAKAIATFLANYLNAHRYYPYFAGFIMAGFNDKPEMYSTDIVGGFGKVDEFTSIGSGSTFAMGVLDKGFKKDITKKEAVELAADAVKAARKRDVFSGGDVVDLLLITKDGIEELKK